MKKLIPLLVASSITLLSNFALAGSFAQLGLGYSKGDNDGDIATGFAGLNVLGNIGARLEFSKNISEHPEFSREDVSRYGIFATYTLPLTSRFSITPKVGLTKVDGKFETIEVVKAVSDSSTEFTYGLEANYHYNAMIAFFVGYTDYGNELDIKDIDTSKMDTKNYTLGIKLDL
jgi:hypothetical protein